MSRTIFLSILSTLFVFNAAFAEQAPDKLVLDTFDKVKAKLENKADIDQEQLDRELREMVDGIFDFPAMARASLSANWNKATPEEREEYVDLFSELLFDTYLKRIKESIGEAKIKLEGVARNKEGDKAIVKTKVDNGKEVAAIQYRMKNVSNAWRVYDVVVENVGLVSNYRSEFSSIIRKDKMAGLLEKLREKQIKNQTSAAGTEGKISDLNFKL